MTSPSGTPELDLCCLPGDITVTKVPSGYLVGRALDQIGPGPWWEYIAITTTYPEAYKTAKTLAVANGRNSWLHKHGDDYAPLPDPDVAAL
jgi:hypothetical protein